MFYKGGVPGEGREIYARQPWKHKKEYKIVIKSLAFRVTPDFEVLWEGVLDFILS